MTNYKISIAIDELAERFIPEGTHKQLHVNSREAWKDLMFTLIERKAIPMKLSYFTRCAVSWEALLIQRISSLN
jgi:hypothetical protein